MTIMNQTYDTSGSYLERLMQEQQQHVTQQQHATQQQLQQLHQFPNGNTNAIRNTASSSAYNTSSGNNDLNSSGLSMSGGGSSADGFQCGSFSSGGQIGAGGLFTHQQQQENQNRMLALLKERQQQQQQQQQQQFGNSDLSSARGLPNNNVGIDSRLVGVGVGVGVGSNAWMEGAYNNTGSTNGVGSLYSNEQQDLLLGSQQRYNPHHSLQGDSSIGINNNLSFSNNGGLNSHHSMQQNHCITSPHVTSKTFADMVLAKQAQVAFLEAAQSQLPRTTRLPCGARGMKADHNSSVSII